MTAGFQPSVPASMWVTFLQVARGNWRRRLVMYPLAGNMEEELLGEKFFGMTTNDYFFSLVRIVSVRICVRPEGVRNILCKVSLPLSSLRLHSLVCQSEQGLIWMGFSFLSRKALTRYQMLFRHMFYCKHVERQLCNVWISNKTAKQFSLHSAKWYGLFVCWITCEVLGFLLAS